MKVCGFILNRHRTTKDTFLFQMDQKMTELIKSCGVVVVRLSKRGWKFLLLENAKYKEPAKGKMDEGETEFETACREVEEEAGLTVKDLDFKWGQVFYETEQYKSKKNKKFVRFYIAETAKKQITLPINPELGHAEHDDYHWLTFDEAMKVCVPRIQKVLEWAKSVIGG
jgi:bis(5'-nucleosidyl)-tetraphosphatase